MQAGKTGHITKQVTKPIAAILIPRDGSTCQTCHFSLGANVVHARNVMAQAACAQGGSRLGSPCCISNAAYLICYDQPTSPPGSTGLQGAACIPPARLMTHNLPTDISNQQASTRLQGAAHGLTCNPQRAQVTPCRCSVTCCTACGTPPPKEPYDF